VVLRFATKWKLPRRIVLPYLRIATKEFLGFGSVLLMLATVSLLAVHSIDRSTAELAASTNTIDVVDGARAIDRSFVELVRRVREYAWVGKEDDVEAATSQAARIKEQVAARLDQAVSDDEKRRFDSLLRFTNAYVEALDRVAALKHSRAEAIRDTLTPSGVAGRDEISAMCRALGSLRQTVAQAFGLSQWSRRCRSAS
jgi:hypothetical protein